MQRLFISDLHLEAPTSPAFLRFSELLDHESRRVDEIYILGDLVEMWVGDDEDTGCAPLLREVLQDAGANCNIFLMHGNRDFLFGETFAAATGISLIDDPYVLDDDLLLCHGDMLCTDDVDYQAMRRTVRSPQWQQEFLSKSLAERQAFGAGLRAQSKANNANKPSGIMDVNADALSQLMTQHTAKRLIHGHTHRPGHYQERIVTGAWERCGWSCRQRDQVFTLECFSLANPYPG